MNVFVFCIFTVLSLATVEANDHWPWSSSYLNVKTTTGQVRGYSSQSCRTGKHFAGFRGIPYAQPPLKELRFKAPLPIAPWEGVWDATFQRPTCVQGTLDESSFSSLAVSEDCLYLNIYTPNVNYLKSNFPFLISLKPVMVFIHPGAFTTGSSNEDEISPDFLIDQDVVLVTFNYRLGALGFLSLQNEEVPGNAGLKDQTLALMWVKANIKHFGGDPRKITIFGESAGSASVCYHMLSKSSQGLFSGAIMQSGTAISSWAYSTPELSIRKANNLAKKVGCANRNATVLLNCLQKVPAETIILNQQKALTVEELLSLKIIAFHPTTEPNVTGAFITKHPYELLESGEFAKVPVIIGMNLNEGLLIYSTLTNKDPHGFLLTLLGMDLSRFAPYYFHLKPFTKPALFAHQQISQFYFHSRHVTKSQMSNALELVTDVMFTLPIQLTADFFSKARIPVYNYMFTYDGRYNLMKAAMNISDIQGVCHGDDLGYLFYVPQMHTQCGANETKSPDENMIDRMTKMWSNFAYTGKPTPSSKDPLLPFNWQQFTSTERHYLDIGMTMAPSDSIKLSNIYFWENLIKQLLQFNDPNAPREAIDSLEIPDVINYI